MIAVGMAAAIFTGLAMIYIVQYVLPVFEPVMTATIALPAPAGSVLWYLIVVPTGIGGPIALFFGIFRLLNRVTGEKS